MTGTDERPEPDGVIWTETDETFSRYAEGMLTNEDSRVVELLTAGPFILYQVRGHTGHLMVLNTHPRCDHADLAGVFWERHIGPAWSPFAAAANVEEEWEVVHYEPVTEARPLQECC